MSTPTPIRRLKVFGERNTGTNFVEQVLLENFSIEVCEGNLPRSLRMLYTGAYKLLPYRHAFSLVESHRDKIYIQRFQHDFGWKHARLPNLPSHMDAYPDDLGLICIVKNPYSWLLSLHRRPYQGQIHSVKNRLTFSEFLRTPWKTVGRECARDEYSTPVEMWNDKAGSYLKESICPRRLVITYEQLISDLPGFIQLVSTTFSIPKSGAHTVPPGSTKRDGRTTEEILQYYQSGSWMDALSSSDISFISENVQPDLMSFYNYRNL